MTFPGFDLEGALLVLTGGSGGLGRVYAKELRSVGARVVVLDLSPSEEEEDDFLRTDITSRESLEESLAIIQDRYGEPVGLINNAALDSPPDSPPEDTGPFESYPLASWEKVLSVNLTGVFLTCQVFGGAMAQAGKGSIINVASIYGKVSPDQRIYRFREEDSGKSFFKPVAYSASKSGLYNFTRYLATYWAESGVRVNSLTLGGVFANQDRRFLDGYEGKVPLGRMAKAEDYVGPLIFLLSEASNYMTGSDLVVDGGWTAW